MEMTGRERSTDRSRSSAGESGNGVSHPHAGRQRRRLELHLDQAPRVRVLEDLRGELRVEGMAGPMCDEMANHRIADEREVADRVEDLVADELVLEAERVVEDAGLAQHDRVLERSAERESILAEHLDVFEKRERPCRRDVLAERFLG